MRSMRGSGGNSRSERVARSGDFLVNPITLDSEGKQTCTQVEQETSGSTEIEIGIGRQMDRVIAAGVQLPTASNSTPSPVAGSGHAVTDKDVTAGQRLNEFACRGGEWMFGPVPCAIEPPNFATRALLRQGVQHRQDRSRPYSGAEQDNRPFATA